MRRKNSVEIKKNVELSNEIFNKVDSLGIKNFPYGIGADLSDICFESQDIIRLTKEFLKAEPDDWDGLSSIIIELDIRLQHMKDHISDTKKPLMRLSNYCEKKLIQSKKNQTA